MYSCTESLSQSVEEVEMEDQVSFVSMADVNYPKSAIILHPFVLVIEHSLVETRTNPVNFYFLS